MQIGIPKEVMNNEERVALLPAHIKTLTDSGHQVLVENNAGAGSGYFDEDYINAGALCTDKEAVFAQSQLIIKVKEPTLAECRLLNAEHILFGYLHLAAKPQICQALLDSGCTALAYETLENSRAELPLLQPMSAIAGRLAVQAGAYHLQSSCGGKGQLLSGAIGTPRAQVLIIGSGIAGSHACDVAVGMGANVSVFDINTDKLAALEQRYKTAINTIYNHNHAIESYLANADLIIGAALIPGAKAPKLISEQQLEMLSEKTVLVDIAIDQGGVFAGSRATTYAEPTYEYKKKIFYCVSNMPAAVAKTASYALANSTIKYIKALADSNAKAMYQPQFKHALNIENGKIMHPQVMAALSPTLK